MNNKMRFLNSCLGGKIDRFFRMELGTWESTIYNWKAAGKLPQEYKSTVKVTHDMFYKHFGMDFLYRLPLATGDITSPFFPKFKEIVIEEGIDWRIIRDVDGITKKIYKDKTGLDSMPQFMKFPVTERADWEKLKEEHMDPSNVEKYLGDVQAVADELVDRDFPVEMVFCGAFGHPRNLFGDENLSYALYDDPEMIDDIMGNWCTISKKIASIVCNKIEVDNLFLWEDMCYKNGPLIDPKLFRRFMLPKYCELIDHCRSLGVKSFLVDTDGDCHKMIPLFMEAGVNIMQPFEVQAGMDVIEVRKKYGNKLAIMGGIDKRVLTMDKSAIKTELDRILPFFMDSGSYIPTLDHNVPNNVPYDNFMYYLELKHNYMEK